MLSYFWDTTLAGPRLYKLLFDNESDLSQLLSNTKDNRLKGISNEELKCLIYVILSWKEQVDAKNLTGIGFDKTLSDEIDKRNGELEKCKVALEKCKVEKDKPLIELSKYQIEQSLDRLARLRNWHDDFVRKEQFHPFMSDVIANTICADLLDYLPRDRMNLGMEYSQHDRIQRFLTIREGTLYHNERLRLSILVTRTQKGGQRRDVATAVLRIMRERYEMAERVYFHHKKAAVSSMLATLVEICPKPKDDESVYPAPWTSETDESHILHFTDSSLIDYLGKAPLDTEKGGLLQRKLNLERGKLLQRKLYLGIKYIRKDIYRTLLVLDTDLVHASAHALGYFADHFRSEKRIEIEEQLTSAANAEIGDVLIYCPSPNMQAKEIDARLEIIPEQILPLSVQQKLFAYNEDVRVLQHYYNELWRSYIFVSKEIFEDRKRCKAIIDKFCDLYKINNMVAYGKVRTYEFDSDEETVIKLMEPIQEFLYNPENGGLPFTDTPTPIIASFIKKAMQGYDKIISDGDPFSRRRTLTSLFSLATLETYSERLEDKRQKDSLNKIIKEVSAGEKDFNPRPRPTEGKPFKTFKEFEDALVRDALGLTEEGKTTES